MYRQPPGESGQGPRFESQAEHFDRRAGLPAAASARVARAVAKHLPEQGILLEIGAGTGDLGRHLVAGAPGMSMQRPYFGLDVSPAMLRVFARRIRETGVGFGEDDRNASNRRARGQAPFALVVADADAPWPVADASVGLVLASRVAHLLDADHLVAEMARSAGPAGTVLLLGRVRRPADSVRSRLRRELHRLLEARGVQVRGGKDARERLYRRLETGGADPGPIATAAAWQTTESPEEALAAWSSKPGLAGASLRADLQREILERLARRAETLFESSTKRRRIRETYELRAFTFPSSRSRRQRATRAAAGGAARALRPTREMP
ncbi:MAG: class I SAM-dependent methyltransferase [Holophagales bacterium]|nr:class I SAM-dependent methyltransferase [Holophagales bacterium]